MSHFYAFKWGNFWDGFPEKPLYRAGFQESKLTRNRWIATKKMQYLKLYPINICFTRYFKYLVEIYYLFSAYFAQN